MISRFRWECFTLNQHFLRQGSSQWVIGYQLCIRCLPGVDAEAALLPYLL